MPQNPPGVWAKEPGMSSGYYRFLAPGYAVYGRVINMFDNNGNHFPWYWEARVSLQARLQGNLDQELVGYAPTQESAMKIVEMLLEETDTISKGETHESQT